MGKKEDIIRKKGKIPDDEWGYYLSENIRISDDAEEDVQWNLDQIKSRRAKYFLEFKKLPKN